MRGSPIGSSGTNTLISSAAYDIPDDILFTLGDDSDIAVLLNSAGLASATELTGVFEGTSVKPTIAASTLIISNVTNDGDIIIAASDGGNSKAAIFFDASTPDLYLYNVGGTWTAGATTWTIPAVTAGGNISMGANFLKTTNITFGQWTSSALYIRNAGNTDWLSLGLLKLTVHEGISINIDAGSIDAKNTAANYFTLKARDTGASALQEVMRIGGAAIPFMSMPADTQVGFFGVAVASQQAHLADASGCTGDADDKVNTIIDVLKAYGLMAPDP